MSSLRRDYLPRHLKTAMAPAKIDGVIAVQARQNLEETRWLLELTCKHDFIFGTVGWAPLISPDLERILEPLASDPNLRGIRHVLEDEPDDNYMLREDFNRGIAVLQHLDLAYDILIREHQLSQSIQFVDRNPNQIFVLDHAAKPRIRDQILSPWKQQIQELACRENVYCKLSGLAREADSKGWTEEELAPYFETIIEAFGPSRLMVGSDWPVCLLSVEYHRWFEVIEGFIASLSISEQARVLGKTAYGVYCPS